MAYTILDGIAGRPKEFAGSGTLPTPADLRAGDLAYDIANGITYEYDGTTPIAVGGWATIRTGGGAHSYDQSQKLTQGLLDSSGNPKTTATTAFPRHAQDVNAYALHTTGGAVVAADLYEFSWTETDVDGIVLTPWGGANFVGMYVTLATTDIGTAAAALRLASSGVNTGGTTDRNRFFIPKDKSVLIPLRGLQYGWLIAIDTDGSEDNNCEVIPV